MSRREKDVHPLPEKHGGSGRPWPLLRCTKNCRRHLPTGQYGCNSLTLLITCASLIPSSGTTIFGPPPGCVASLPTRMIFDRKWVRSRRLPAPYGVDFDVLRFPPFSPLSHAVSNLRGFRPLGHGMRAASRARYACRPRTSLRSLHLACRTGRLGPGSGLRCF